MKISDVLIIGSGPTGIAAAWPLVKAGLSVVMVDGHQGVAPSSPMMSLDDFHHDEDRWLHTLGKSLENAMPLGNRSPKFTTPLGQSVLAKNEELLPLRTSGFFAPRSYAAGGLSNIWGALASAFDREDLSSFPFALEEIAESYRDVAARIGISGANDEMGEFHGVDVPLQPPDWLMPIAQGILERYKKQKPTDGFKLGVARNAVLTSDMGHRLACNRSGMCLYGCSRGSVYNSAHEIPILRSYSNFTYLGGHPVQRILDTSGALQTVEALAEGKKITLGARSLILAAGTINTTALVLQHYNVIGKKLRLLSSPAGAIAFLIPSKGNKVKNNDHFSLGQLSYSIQLNDEKSGYATGSFYSVDTLPLTVVADRLPLARPIAMKFAAALAPHLLIANCFLPGDYSENSISLQKGWNANEFYIEGRTLPHAHKTLKMAMKRLARIMHKTGAIALPGSFSVVEPGADAHIGGSLPMSDNTTDLTCSAAGELRPWANVYVADGASLSSLPAKHCTFTLMANADRIGKNLANKLLQNSSGIAVA